MTTDAEITQIYYFPVLFGFYTTRIMTINREGLLKQLGIDMTLTESVLEDEGMHVFEWWGGEYRPLDELIAEMDEVKKK